MLPIWKTLSTSFTPTWQFTADSGPAPLLSLLLGGPNAHGKVGAGTLTGDQGETVSVFRASSKTCQTSSTATKLLSSNEPSVEPKGLVIEEPHTNLVLQSQDFTTTWAPLGNVSAAPVVTAAAALAPDGTLTASQLAVAAATGGDYSIIWQLGISVTSSTTYTFSVWLRGASSGTTYLVVINPGSGAVIASTQVDYTTSWARYSVSAAIPSGLTVAAPAIGNYGPAHAGTASTFFAWQADFIQSAYMQSAIPTTTTAATCIGDVITMDGTLLPVAQGSMSCKFTPEWSNVSSGGGNFYIFSTYDNTHGIAFGIQSNAVSITCEGGGGFASSALTWVPGQTYLLEVVWGAGNWHVYRDGVLETSVTDGSLPITAHGATFWIGNYFGIDGFRSEGRISDLAFFAT